MERRARICRFWRSGVDDVASISPLMKADDLISAGISSVLAGVWKSRRRRNGGIFSCGTVADVPCMYFRRLTAPRPSQSLHACSDDESVVGIAG